MELVTMLKYIKEVKIKKVKETIDAKVIGKRTSKLKISRKK